MKKKKTDINVKSIKQVKSKTHKWINLDFPNKVHESKKTYNRKKSKEIDKELNSN